MASVREAFDSADGGWQVTVSVPYDYDSLKGFNLEYLEPHVDWFNLQGYETYALWDVDWTGDSHVQPHSNITTISDTLALFKRNGIDSDKIVLGYGLHGTSYTLNDTACSKPGCPFAGPGFEGACTDNVGFLSYSGQSLLQLHLKLP